MTTRPSFGVFNGLTPRDGIPKSMPVQLDFSTLAVQIVDLLLEETLGGIEFVQGIYVDNSANTNALTLVFGITNQRIVIPALSQGMWPVIAPEKTYFTCATTATPGLIVMLQLLNVPTAYTMWGPLTLNVANVAPSQGVFVNRGGFIAAAGVSQQIAAINAARKLILIENPGSAAGQNIAVPESLFVNMTAAAGVDNGTSWEVFPGGYWPPSNVNVVSTEAVNVNAASINHVYIAKEM